MKCVAKISNFLLQILKWQRKTNIKPNKDNGNVNLKFPNYFNDYRTNI